MAVIGRKRKSGTTYYVVLEWQGRQTWERSGTDKRAAERLETQRKREIANGTYTGTTATRATTVGAYAATWGAARTNRSADDDRQRLRDHAVSREWFASLRLDDVRVAHVQRLVAELNAAGLAGKTVSNVYGTVRTMFRDARVAELMPTDVCVIPRGTIKRSRTTERTPYTRAEVAALTTDPRVDADRRIFAALAFYTGCREGEVCGLRWRDWDREAAPLGCLSVLSQYGGAVLKTDRPRKVPVHPVLAAALAAWERDGFEIVHCRRPKPDDFIVPMRANRANHHGVRPHHTKSSAYKMFRAACLQAEVENRSLHATRHTMITWARRGGARKDVLEKVTHNAGGDIVDQYTHFDWQPLCEAVLAIRYLDAEIDASAIPAAKTVEAPGIEAGSRGVNLCDSATIREINTVAGPPKILGETRTRCKSGRASRRLFRECVALATGATKAADPEREVSDRLALLARTLPHTVGSGRRTA